MYGSINYELFEYLEYVEYLGKNCGRNVARSLLNSVLFYANCDREPLYNERIIKQNKLN
jgi:hypothetical protein